MAKLDWNETDDLAVNTVRVLAMDSVQKVGNGHPGTAMSLAPAAYLLFQKVMRHDPSDPHWPGRDRFVLSCGHSSLTLYIQLYLGGWGLELEDLKSLRTWGSKTPGHPEYGHTAGVETTTGPLGQGVGNAVGMAMAARREHGLLDPNAALGDSPFDHFIYALASDGDLEEGVGSEASSIAGTQQLGNLILIYDDNQISIEDNTDIAFNEDVEKRYEAYGWHVQTSTGPTAAATDADYREDVPALYDAILTAKRVTDKPSFIRLRTIIGWPAPNLQNTFKAHGNALGDDEVAATKKVLGWDPDLTFEVPAGRHRAHPPGHRARPGRAGRVADDVRRVGAQAVRQRRPLRAAPDAAPSPGVGPTTCRPSRPTRRAWPPARPAARSSTPSPSASPSCGAARPTWPSPTTPPSRARRPSSPPDRATKIWKADPLAGRVLHFGIREHAMGAIMNGIAVHGGTRVFGGTFLTFSDYMRGAVRLAAIMQLPVTYVWTHDSIGLGEDGPTHQPIEHLAALRAIPGLDIVRPADANETAACWRTILEHNDRPAGLALTRQNVPTFPRGEDGFNDTGNVAKGGYVLIDADGDGPPDVVLVGTGSEVQLAVEARTLLAEKGVRARVVSMPCREWFDEQEASYRETVIPPTVKARVSVEAGVAQGWREVVGDHGRIISIDHYGASADFARIYREFGVTAQAVADAAEDSIRVATS